MTIEKRYEQALLELQTAETDLAGKYLLDAGCGNGLLTEYFSTRGAVSFGLDFSTSVFVAEKRRKSDTVCFVQGDLKDCPFQVGTFDIVYSPGVIHHTPLRLIDYFRRHAAKEEVLFFKTDGHPNARVI